VKINLQIKPGMINSYLLIVLTVICFLLTVIRHIITGRLSYYFLNWNLFLAAIPWLISLIITSGFVMKKPKGLTVVLFIIWLLFFPNAPYITTDLYYLRNHPERTFWYDMIMILMFAWTGLLFGFFSLDRIRGLWAEKLSKIKSFIITCVLLFICAFGVYLGRDLRWNSWEILFAPKDFFFDVIDRFLHPIGYRRAWSFTFIMGGFLNIIYWSLKIIRGNDQSLTIK
jgi:uncharacterized membrane protein